MSQKKRVTVLALAGVCFVLAAVMMVFLLLHVREKGFCVRLSVRGEGSVVVTGAASLETESEQSIAAEVGQTLNLRAEGEDFAYWLLDSRRLSAQEVSFTVPNKEVAVQAVFCDTEVSKAAHPYEPDVIVYEAQEVGSRAKRPFFPTVTQAEDGTILVVYYYADGHALYHQADGKLSGVLQLVKSRDGGKTWSNPETIVDLTDENPAKGDFNRESRDPNLQRLSDGTILLTFPVRAPIGKPGINGSSQNDYWAERSYYMTSTDNGETWGEMTLIECDFFSDEPFLYDDPERTTGCWVKNGSVAELEGGDLLIPLYGASTCDSRGEYQGVVVKAKNNGDGTLTFYKDWAIVDGKTTDASLVLPKGQGNELALYASGKTVYALARTAIPSRTAGGVVYRSTDGGQTFSEYAMEPTANDCLNQPNFCALGGDLVLVNYSVPLASVYDSPAKRTARPVYGKLFNTRTGDWDEYEAITVYDVESATVADMANPASVLLDDGRIMTVYYDTSAPALRHGFIGASFTDVCDYLSEAKGQLSFAVDALLAD